MTLIPDWGPWIWLILGVVIFIGVTFEGAYRIVSKRRDESLKSLLSIEGKRTRNIRIKRSEKPVRRNASDDAKTRGEIEVITIVTIEFPYRADGIDYFDIRRWKIEEMFPLRSF